ncbi:MAG TPA: AraC family transcriptional regulator [Gemmatimonadales bacterium]|jgi:AraC-like DNA-binding protein
MASDDAVRFWRSAPEVSSPIVCAYLQAGRPVPHVHEEWQFAVAEIPARLSLGAFRRHTARESDVTVVAPYDVHAEEGAIGSMPRWRALYVAPSLVDRLYREVTGGSQLAVPRFASPVLADPAAAGELRALLLASEEGGISGGEFVESIRRWLEQLLRRHAVAAAAPGRLSAVERARTYLQERPTEPVRLQEVGAAAGVTVSHLVRSFSIATGLPPRSYHAQVRLARAQRLLAEGKPATWVAYECGFADQSHLSRRFKESLGLTPRAFQAQVRAA